MRRIRFPELIFIYIILATGLIFAQKPELNRQLEILNEGEETSYRFENKRVSKESGVPVALYRVNFTCKPAAPEVMALQYLRANAPLLQIAEPAVSLRHIRTIETPGGYHVRYQQVYNAYPVYNSTVVVNFDRKNTVTFVMNSYKPNVQLANIRPAYSAESARQTALAYLNVKGSLRYETQETVVYHDRQKTRLAHRIVIVPAEDLFGDWEVLVDAQTGEIFRVEDKAIYNGPRHRATGSGWVFDPDPLTHARANYQTGGQFGDNNDANSDSLTAHTVQRDLLDIEFDGTNYHLRGPYARIVDSESPFNGLFSQPNNQWHNLRNAAAFEAANVYYHIDASMRYINEELGFSLMPFQYSGGVKGDPHGLNGADNSHYIPSIGELAWGEGGVDDAEDADVILHELGHGLHDWLTNGSLSQVNGLSEGCGDYWANSYNRSKGFWTPADPQYWWTFQWDGHNQFWGGRITNYSATYPGGLTGQIHTDGQIWASTLMQIWDDIGRFATDSNFLEALAMTNSSTNQQDAAQAFVQADINLFGGANLGPIVTHFTNRGYNINVPIPQIDHSPLADTENVNGPYVVTADITASNTLTTVQLIFGTDGAFSDTLDMSPTRAGYSASIPGTGASANYNYYILAVDANDLAATSPANAPASFHAFATGPDTEPPLITHTPLNDQALVRWPAMVTATVTDNLGIATVVVEYEVNGGAQSGSFNISDTGNDVYRGEFDIPAGSLSTGDVVEYRIIATDASSQSNQRIDPATGFHSFEIVDIAGLVLIIDDDPSSQKTRYETEKGSETRDLHSNPFGASATNMQTYLAALGYVAIVETPSTTDPATWENYDVIISASGINLSPVANSAYRTALENWVSDPTHKLLIEGGEVGYDAVSSPGYPTFAANVLHSSNWVTDNAGNLNRVTAQNDHPLVTTPNALPTPLAISYSGWGSEDAVNAIGGAYLLYETANHPNNAGISIFDDNSDPRSAQIVYYAFNFAQLSNQSIAADLLENTIRYLLEKESLVNVVNMPLRNRWNLISLPLSSDENNYQTLFPNALQQPYYWNGAYQQTATMDTGAGYWLYNGATETLPFSGLPVDSVTIHLRKGWNLIGGSSCEVPVANIIDDGNLIVPPLYEFDGAYQNATTVTGGKGYWLNAAAAGTIKISCDATAAKRQPTALLDLSSESRITVTDPTGLQQILYFGLKNLTEKEALQTKLPPLPPPGSFDARFKGDLRAIPAETGQILLQSANYPLTLRFENLAITNNEQYVLREMSGGETVVVHPVAEGVAVVISNPGVTRLDLAKIATAVPQSFELAQNYPNPFNPVTLIRYQLPANASVTLEIFNTIGQRVRTLVSGEQNAGFYTIEWDASNDSGDPVASGIYMYRLTAGEFSAVRKMILLR